MSEPLPETAADRAREIIADAGQRIVVLPGSHGCEAAAELARAEGRIEAARLILDWIGATADGR